jgi:hypothetical protein
VGHLQASRSSRSQGGWRTGFASQTFWSIYEDLLARARIRVVGQSTCGQTENGGRAQGRAAMRAGAAAAAGAARREGSVGRRRRSAQPATSIDDGCQSCCYCCCCCCCCSRSARGICRAVGPSQGRLCDLEPADGARRPPAVKPRSEPAGARARSDTRPARPLRRRPEEGKGHPSSGHRQEGAREVPRRGLYRSVGRSPAARSWLPVSLRVLTACRTLPVPRLPPLPGCVGGRPSASTPFLPVLCLRRVS